MTKYFKNILPIGIYFPLSSKPCQNQYILAIFVLSLILNGCASSTGIQSKGSNRYWVEGASEFGLQLAKEKALKDAAKYCGSPEKVSQIFSSNDSHIDFLGDRVHTWKLEFSCGYAANQGDTNTDYRNQQRSSNSQKNYQDIQFERQVQAVNRAYEGCTLLKNDRDIIQACTDTIRLEAKGSLLKPQARIAVFFTRSLAYARLQYYDRAITDMQWVVSNSPNDYKARNILADLRSDQLSASRANQPVSSSGKERWVIELSGINDNTVRVNGRQIFKQKKGRNRINISQFFHNGTNTVEIWRKHVGSTNGQRAIVRRGAQVALTLLPKDLSPMGFELGGKRALAKIQIHRQTGACWIKRGWGGIHGRVEVNNRIVDVSGWEPCEQYRYIPQQPIVAHGMPFSSMKPTAFQILKAIYKSVPK